VSGRAPLDLEPPPFPGQRLVSPWRGAIIGGIIVAVVIGLGLMVSGELPGFRKKEEKPQLPTVQFSSNLTPVERPVEVKVDPQRQLEQQRQTPQQQTFGPQPKTKMQAFSLRNAGAAAAAAKQQGSSNPDGIPPSSQADALSASLQPTKMDGVRVAELPHPDYLIQEGRVLPCVQQTRINSTLPGAVTAIIPVDIRGETSTDVLLPKGAKIFGTIKQGLLNGLDRLAVLWQDIRTPILYDDAGVAHQFTVAVNSPAATELGETGVDGDVNRHMFNPFPGKIGAIVGMSLIQGGIQAGVNYANNANSKGNGNSQTNLNFNQFAQGGQSASDELLRSFVQIPDIMTRDQGLACSIFVVRDLDMYPMIQLMRKYKRMR